jgi:hypothetical protein
LRDGYFPNQNKVSEVALSSLILRPAHKEFQTLGAQKKYSKIHDKWIICSTAADIVQAWSAGRNQSEPTGS